MSDIAYDEDQDLPSRPYAVSERRQSTMVRWLLKLGIKDERTANHVLIGIAICCFILTLFFLLTGTHSIRPSGSAVFHSAP